MAPQDVNSWHTFENVVATMFRSLGAETIRQNFNLAGNQIDIYMEERTSSGQRLRTAIECKFYKSQVPKDVVIQFAAVATFLRQAVLIDKAIMVGYQGFTQSAFLAAESAKIELLDFAELETRVNKIPIEVRPHMYGPIPRQTTAEIFAQAQKQELPESFPDTVFVAMPFSEEMEDVYIYGIRKAAQEARLTCKRADEMEHTGPIIDEIIDHIRRCRIIVAEVTQHNPNVFYEVGWSHALAKETILVAKDGSELPFDVRHINTIIYKNIHQLEERLTSRLKAIMGHKQ